MRKWVDAQGYQYWMPHETQDIPDDFRVVIATPLAYPLEACYDEAAKERLGQRTRKDLPELVYLGQWRE